jgi:hypothetical protein
MLVGHCSWAVRSDDLGEAMITVRIANPADGSAGAVPGAYSFSMGIDQLRVIAAFA